MEEEKILDKWENLYTSSGYTDRQSRQDSDMDLYQLAVENLKDYKDKDIPDAYNLITSNRPATYADRVTGALANGDLQIVVEIDGKGDDSKCADIEEMWRMILKCIDIYISVLMGEPPLLEIVAGQVALRGDIPGVCFPYADEKYLIPHVIPWDSRYCATRGGRQGLSLAGYRTNKSKEQIEEEYKDAEFEASGDEIEFSDIWTPEANLAYAGKDLINQKSISFQHNLGYVPVSDRFCSATIWHKDSDYFKYKGESVYANIRNLITGYNSLLSVVYTLTMKAFTNSLQFPNREGPNAKFEDNPRADNQVNPIWPEDKFLPMPLNDIEQATVMLKAMLDQDILFGSLPLMEYGEMSDQETVAQITTKAAKTASVLKPRRRAIEMFYDDIAYMFLSQLKDRNLPRIIKLRGMEFNLPKVSLDGNWTIKHTLNVVSPQQDIANAALAQALERYLDLETLLEKIIQVDDPSGVISKKVKEDVERMLPQVKALRVAVEKLDSKDDVEKAEGVLIAMELGVSPEALEKGEVEGLKEQPQPAQGNKTLMPLLKG